MNAHSWAGRSRLSRPSNGPATTLRTVTPGAAATDAGSADDVEAGTLPRPDLVLWPENASDISPMANADAAQEITDASVSVGAPIVFGTLLADGPEGRPTNTVLVWDQQRGPVDRYDKHIIQPFGEYLPGGHDH